MVRVYKSSQLAYWRSVVNLPGTLRSALNSGHAANILWQQAIQTERKAAVQWVWGSMMCILGTCTLCILSCMSSSTGLVPCGFRTERTWVICKEDSWVFLRERPARPSHSASATALESR